MAYRCDAVGGGGDAWKRVGDVPWIERERERVAVLVLCGDVAHDDTATRLQLHICRRDASHTSSRRPAVSGERRGHVTGRVVRTTP